MGIPYAEVIGDPVAHSKSPLIHRFWLEKLGIDGDFRAHRLSAASLPSYLADRCRDPFWRGCSVTAPLKLAAARLANDPTGVCARIGAANALFRSSLGCAIGANTDVLALAAALDASETSGEKVCVIGAGGAARSALEYLRARDTMKVDLVARDVERARPVHQAFAGGGSVYSFEDCREALGGASWVINATPLGMADMPAMPPAVLDGLEETEDYALVFDMVYSPVETALLERARTIGRKTVDGLTMLVEQAQPAFELFFGARAPRQHDAELRELLS